MQNRLKSFLALSAVLISATAYGQDWPQWRGPGNNGISASKGLPATWSKTENVAWRVELPGPGGATPCLWGDMAFVTSTSGNDLVLVAVDIKAGKIKWQTKVSEGDKVVRGQVIGKVGNKQTTIKARQIYKGSELKGDRKYYNVGYVSEGLFGMGLFLALLNERPIEGDSIQQGVMKYLKSNGDKVMSRNKDTKDKISLQTYLPDNDFKGLKDPKTYQDKEIKAHMDSIANYVNNSSDFKKLDAMFSNNKKIAIEVQGSQHTKYNRFFHGEHKNNYLEQLKRKPKEIF